MSSLPTSPHAHPAMVFADSNPAHLSQPAMSAPLLSNANEAKGEVFHAASVPGIMPPGVAPWTTAMGYTHAHAHMHPFYQPLVIPQSPQAPLHSQMTMSPTNVHPPTIMSPSQAPLSLERIERPTSSFAQSDGTAVEPSKSPSATLHAPAPSTPYPARPMSVSSIATGSSWAQPVSIEHVSRPTTRSSSSASASRGHDSFPQPSLLPLPESVTSMWHQHTIRNPVISEETGQFDELFVRYDTRSGEILDISVARRMYAGRDVPYLRV